MKYLFGSFFAGLLCVAPASAEVPISQDSVQPQGTAPYGIITQSGTGAQGADTVPRIRAGDTPRITRIAALAKEAAGRPDFSAAKARIGAMGDTAISVLQRKDLPEAQRRREFRRLLQNNFQVNAIAILTLGRHRAAASPRQRKEFDELFTEFVLIRVSELLDNYTNESFKVDDVIKVGKRDVAVRSHIVPERGEAKEVHWVMREFHGQPQIIDVRVENISLVITQRDEFNSVIQREGMDGLLRRLRKQVSTYSTEAKY